jgi:spore coat polysaccharide biosynthesis protein SpsF (cytidylyltransferase family)
MTTLGIIQARLGSSRFPNKILAGLDGKAILQHVIERARQATTLDNLIIATDRESSRVLEPWCQLHGIKCLWVDDERASDDVLYRFAELCRSLPGSRVIVRICGDNPRLWPEGIDELIRNISLVDYVGYEWNDKPAILCPNGVFAEAFWTSSLFRLDKKLRLDSPWREHVTRGFYEQPHNYRCRFLPAPSWYNGERLSVDWPADLERLKECPSSS